MSAMSMIAHGTCAGVAIPAARSRIAFAPPSPRALPWRRVSAHPPSSPSRGRESSLVVRASRFRDESERQRAIDRLSPPPPDAPPRQEDDGPLPSVTRTSTKTRPKRFKDAMKLRDSAGGLPGLRSRDEDEEDGPDPRELARQRRLERKEAESSDRLEYLVSVIRQELGRPQSLLALDGKTRQLRSDSLSHRLRNFGFVEIMFGLIKYYYAHWDDSEGGDVAGSSAAANDDGAAASASDADEEAEKEEEEARRALLRAAQLRATGAEGRETDEKDEGSSGDDVLDALSELVRSYFSVDFVEGEDGQREMVVMTSPEFLAFLLVAIILAGRFGHFLVQTYFITPVDPLLR